MQTLTAVHTWPGQYRCQGPAQIGFGRTHTSLYGKQQAAKQTMAYCNGLVSGILQGHRVTFGHFGPAPPSNSNTPSGSASNVL